MQINNGSGILSFSYQEPGDGLYDCFIYYENLIQESGIPECDFGARISQPSEKDIYIIE